MLKSDCQRLNLMSNPRGVKGSPYLEEIWLRKRKVGKAKAVDMTEEEQEIIINHLLDSKNGGLTK